MNTKEKKQKKLNPYEQGYFRHQEGMPEDYDDDLQAQWLMGMQDEQADAQAACIDEARDKAHYGEDNNG